MFGDPFEIVCQHPDRFENLAAFAGVGFVDLNQLRFGTALHCGRNDQPGGAKMRSFQTICFLAVLSALQIGQPALSQSNDQNAPPPPSAAPPPATAAPSEPAATLKPAELDALVAPIALYPDTLLANVLMAATYPLEVVRAERWLKDNSKLKGDNLKAAAEKQSWDASVKALIAAPSVLQMMSEQLDWTQKLGEAFLAQQQDVMDAVQRLRSKAYDRKKLSTTKEQVVTVRQEQNRSVIAIEPAAPDTVYVPYYEPSVMFGDWPYANYPAYPYFTGDTLATSPLASSRLASHSGRPTRWAAGPRVDTGAVAAIGAAVASIGAAAASMSIAAPVSSIGSTIRRIVRVHATTIRTFNRSLAMPGRVWVAAVRG
jgi:Protein of unknown function (DUF3300)